MKKLTTAPKEQKKNGKTNLTICNNREVVKVSESNMNEPFHGAAQTFWANLFKD